MARPVLALVAVGTLTAGVAFAAGSAEHGAHRGDLHAPRANLWVTPAPGRCLRSARPAAFAPDRACGSFQAAYDVARGGDVVLVRCVSGRRCTFPAEHITGDRGTPRRRITFRALRGYTVGWDPMAGEPVWIDGLHNATFVRIGAGRRDVGAGGGFDGDLRIDCARDVTFVGMTGRRFHMFEGNARIRFSGGSWGGYSTAGEEDSSIGTTEASGPDGTPCPGERTERPSSDIVFDGVTFHDVFAGTAPGAWGDSHPDCFEINGYTERVTIENSRFERCGNTFWSLYGNQGFNHGVTFTHNVLRGLNDNPAAEEYYGVQVHSDPNAPSTPGRGECGDVSITGNTVAPENPRASYPYSGFLVGCDTAPGMRPVQIAGNTFDMVQPRADCAQSKAPPTRARWRDNRWLRGHAC